MELPQGNRLLLCAGLQPFLLQSWQRGEMGGRGKISDPYVRSSELIFPTKEFHLSTKCCVQNWEVLRRRLGPGWGCDRQKAVPTTGLDLWKICWIFFFSENFLETFWKLRETAMVFLFYLPGLLISKGVLCLSLLPGDSLPVH